MKKNKIILAVVLFGLVNMFISNTNAIYMIPADGETQVERPKKLENGAQLRILMASPSDDYDSKKIKHGELNQDDNSTITITDEELKEMGEKALPSDMIKEQKNIYNDKGELIGQARSMPVPISAPEENYKEFTGIVDKIIQGKDGISAEMKGKNGGKIIATISIMKAKFTDDKNISDIKVGTKLKVYADEVFDEELNSYNVIAVVNKVEILGQAVSDNDLSLYNHINEQLDEKYIEIAKTFVDNTEKKVAKMNEKIKKRYLESFVDKLGVLTSEFLSEYPQDKALPENVNNVYLTLQLIELDIKIKLISGINL